MSSCLERASHAVKHVSSDEAERLLLHLYTGLPLLPAGDDGGRSVELARFGSYEVRLTELPPDSKTFLPLWIDLFSESGLVDGRGFTEIGDAVGAVRELVTRAKRLHDGI